MKHIYGFNQEKALEHGLKISDLVFLRFLIEQLIDREELHIGYDLFSNELPILFGHANLKNAEKWKNRHRKKVQRYNENIGRFMNIRYEHTPFGTKVYYSIKEDELKEIYVGKLR